MKAIELLQKNPESSKLICSYYLEIMLESLKDDNLPEDFKDHVREQGIDNDNISAIIDGNPRNLFDFFDSHGMYINITTLSDTLFFTYSIMYETATALSNDVYRTRKEADKGAIETVIENLELRLTKSVSNNENS
jgi:hypothetical protein